MLQFLCIALMMANVATYQTPHRACVSPNPIKSLIVDGCTHSPCEWTLGQNVHAAIKFKSPVNTECTVLNITVTIEGTTLPSIASNGCTNIANPSCPLKKRHMYTIDYTLPIPTNMPLGCGVIHTEMCADDDCNGVCDEKYFYCVDLDICISN